MEYKNIGVKLTAGRKTMILDLILKANELTDADLVEIGTQEVQEGDKVLGEVGPQGRKLATLLIKEAEEVAAKNIERLGEILGLTVREIAGSVKESQLELKRMELLKELMWQEVREGLPPKSDSDNISIRKGWVVVANRPVATNVIRLGCGDPECPVCGYQPQ